MFQLVSSHVIHCRCKVWIVNSFQLLLMNPCHNFLMSRFSWRCPLRVFSFFIFYLPFIDKIMACFILRREVAATKSRNWSAAGEQYLVTFWSKSRNFVRLIIVDRWHGLTSCLLLVLWFLTELSVGLFIKPRMSLHTFLGIFGGFVSCRLCPIVTKAVNC